MQKLRDLEGGGETEPNDKRMQAFLAVEIVILRRVNQIKSADPADDAEGKNQRR